MTTQTTVTGVVVDREHKDGIISSGSKAGQTWNRYGFQIAGSDGKHWYSSFDTSSWEGLKKGQAYQVFYSTKDNPSGGAPFRNVEWFKEVELEDSPASAAQQQSSGGGSYENRDDKFRTKEELRWTECYHMASRLCSGMAVTGGLIGDIRKEIETWAKYFYIELVYYSGPAAAESEPPWQDHRDGPQASEPPVQPVTEAEVSKSPPRKPAPKSSETKLFELEAERFDRDKVEIYTKDDVVNFICSNFSEKGPRDLTTKEVDWVIEQMVKGSVPTIGSKPAVDADQLAF